MSAHKVPSEGPHEIELKFDVAAADLPLLKRRVAAIEGRTGSRDIQRLNTTYFDTDDLKLKGHGVSLRIREEPGRQLQTVKASRASGTLDRAEWEREVAGSSPDLLAAANTPVAGLLSSKRARRDLKPMFRTEVKRTAQEIRSGRSVIELAFDEVKVVAGRRRAAFCEVELELKSGGTAGLYKVARDLIDAAPLRLSVLSKAERGYALRERTASQAVKAEAPKLAPGVSVADGFRAIAHSCIRQYRLNEAILLQRRDVEALHQARVAMRRLRSAFSLFKKVVADRELEAIKEEMRWASEPLGRARNHDVFLKRASSGHTPEGVDAADFLRLVKDDRELAYDDVTAVPQSPRFVALVPRLVEWLELGRWKQRSGDGAECLRESIESAAASILHSRRRKVRKRGKHLAKLDPMARHRVRIQAKKLRYAAEFFAPLCNGKAERRRHAKFVQALEAMQDELGALNDIATGRELVAGLAQKRAASEPAFVGGLIAGAAGAEEPALLEDADAAQRRFARAKAFW
jgi:inorganic triphosphatase YgiF